MPWTSSSHSIEWECLCSLYSPKWSWFRQNPTVEADNIPRVAKHGPWVLPSTCRKALCEGRMRPSPHFPSLLEKGRHSPVKSLPWLSPGLQPRFCGGQWDNSLSKPWRDPGCEPHLLTRPPASRSTTFPQGPEVCSSHLGLHRLFCWRNWVTDAHLRSSSSLTLSGANANFPHCTSILRIIPF